ncbi:MAG: dTDP-4-dehydrorhamnose 3,5-epimerase [Limisphaerales bacterium]
MRFLPTSLEGLWVIELEPRADERGFLARTYCEQEFGARGLNTRWPQCNLTLTKKRGFIRGLHYQADPKPEIKLIRCAAGAIFDVVADLRPGSATYSRWEGFELTGQNLRQLYVPAGFAHGFQCLSDDCQVLYQMSESYHPALACGVRWDDETLQIRWPVAEVHLSERDRNLPRLSSPS